MSDGEHTHGTKNLTLDDVQTIIGRAMVDESFRAEFTADPEATLKKLHIGLTAGADDKAAALVRSIAAALSEDNTGVSLKDALKTLRESYIQSTDGIIRPRCI
jgi:hypothetical protein